VPGVLYAAVIVGVNVEKRAFIAVANVVDVYAPSAITKVVTVAPCVTVSLLLPKPADIVYQEMGISAERNVTA
jgi:hypothetical protein